MPQVGECGLITEVRWSEGSAPSPGTCLKQLTLGFRRQPVRSGEARGGGIGGSRNTAAWVSNT